MPLSVQKRKAVISAAVKKVNVARKVLGFRPINRLPKGKLMCNKVCPLARALQANVGNDYVTFSSKKKAAAVAKVWNTSAAGRITRSPQEVSTFVDNFDESLLPELVLAKKSSDDE